KIAIQSKVEPLPHYKQGRSNQNKDWATVLELPVDEWYQELEVSIDGEHFVKHSTLSDKASGDSIRIETYNHQGAVQTVLIRRFEALLNQSPRRAKRVFVSYSHSNPMCQDSCHP
ncbi:MAG: hypothetical protein ACPG51_20925, partial [Thiolinea sp.]